MKKYNVIGVMSVLQLMDLTFHFADLLKTKNGSMKS